MLVMVYGATPETLEAHCLTLRKQLPAGVEELTPGQPAGRLQIDGITTRKEHFGFLDGLTNPDVAGVPGDDGPERSQDVGNPDGGGRFRKVPAGEFILGYPGEGGELAALAKPPDRRGDHAFAAAAPVVLDAQEARVAAGLDQPLEMVQGR